MSTVIDSLERAQLRRVPAFGAGDRLRVHFQVIEGTRRRTQVFEGIVIRRQGHGARETFTVRKQSFGVGVERTFPLHSPKIERIEVAARGDVRRAKLYYLRGRVGKRARVRERRNTGPEEAVQRELLYGPEDEEQLRSPTSSTSRSPAPTSRTSLRRPTSRPTLKTRAKRSRRALSESRRRGVGGVRILDGATGRRAGGTGGTRRRSQGVTATRRPLAGSVLELVVIVAAALAAGAPDPGVHRQAVPDSERFDAPDPARQPAGAGQPDRHAFRLPAASARSSCSIRPRTSIRAAPTPPRAPMSPRPRRATSRRASRRRRRSSSGWWACRAIASASSTGT